MLQKHSSLHNDFIEKIKLSFVLSVSYLCTFAVICLNICCEQVDCYFGSDKTEMLHNCLGIQTIFQKIERPVSNLQSLVDFKNSETSKSHNGFQMKDTGQASLGKKFKNVIKISLRFRSKQEIYEKF